MYIKQKKWLFFKIILFLIILVDFVSRLRLQIIYENYFLIVWLKDAEIIVQYLLM